MEFENFETYNISELSWVSIQNLIGGFALAAEEVFKNPPLAIIHCGFYNDKFYINRIKDKNIPIIEFKDKTYQEFKTPEDEKKFNELMLKKPQVAIMTPVCSGNSLMNSFTISDENKRGNADNCQNQNMYNMLRIAMKLDCEVISFENAPTIYNAYFDVIQKCLEIAEGYSCNLIKTNAMKHGLPQLRIRTFLTFFKGENVPLFDFEDLNYEKLPDFLDKVDNYHTEKFDIENNILYKFLLDYSETDHYLKMLKKLNLKENLRCWSILKELNLFDKFIKYCENNKDYKNSENYKNMALTRKSKNGFFDKTCYCPHNGEYVNAIIENNCNWQLHPKENCGLTISEMFALMGMPTDYEFLDNSKKLRDVFLVTQNVPVNSAKYICKNILKYFNKSLNLGKKFIKQDNHLKKVDIFNY
jgi:C-5 cytosine-specific DNA methylase